MMFTCTELVANRKKLTAADDDERSRSQKPPTVFRISSPAFPSFKVKNLILMVKNNIIFELGVVVVVDGLDYDIDFYDKVVGMTQATKQSY